VPRPRPCRSAQPERSTHWRAVTLQIVQQLDQLSVGGKCEKASRALVLRSEFIDQRRGPSDNCPAIGKTLDNGQSETFIKGREDDGVCLCNCGRHLFVFDFATLESLYVGRSRLIAVADNEKRLAWKGP